MIFVVVIVSSLAYLFSLGAAAGNIWNAKQKINLRKKKSS